jgi:hypothetical protein
MVLLRGFRSLCLRVRRRLPLGRTDLDREASGVASDDGLKALAAELNRASLALKGELSVDEPGFRHVAAQAHRNSRDYVVFEALDEIEKMVLAVFQGLELLSGEDLDPADAFTRIGHEYLRDEMSLWHRKMIEVLADLVGFSATPDQPYFRDYLLLVQLDGVVGAQRDQEEFYGSESANYRVQIDELCGEIATLESGSLDPGRAWYRYRRVPLDREHLSPGRVLSSFRKRLQHAMPLATATEQGALGYSYGSGFGRASRGIHARPGLPELLPGADDLRSDLLVAVVIGINLLVRCQETVGEIPTGANAKLRRSLEHSDPALGKTFLKGRAAVGDLVVVADKVGQVIEVRSGEYGYESYLVRYLTKPFLPEVPEDWHVAQQVARLRTAKNIRDELAADVRSGRMEERDAAVLLGLEDEKLTEYYGEGLARLWEAGVGLKEHVLDQLTRKKD